MEENDLISREEAIKALCKAGCGSGYCGVSCDDVMAIERLPSVYPKWIPCSERLPEYGESVLCYFGEDEDFGVNHIIDDEDGEWFIDGATAWMPLPEPWRGEKDD